MPPEPGAEVRFLSGVPFGELALSRILESAFFVLWILVYGNKVVKGKIGTYCNFKPYNKPR